MRIVPVFASFMTAGVLGLSALVATAQSYPLRPVRLVAPEPGSSANLIARVIAQELTGTLGQQVIVDNRGIVAVETVGRSQPDGYTLLFYSDPMWLTPVFHEVAWDPVKDFAPIAPAARAPAVLVVHPSIPAKTVKELIALAQARPGELNYGSGNSGSTPHLGGELFKSMAQVNIVRINFKGTGPAVTALLGGQVQIMFPGAGSVTQHVKAGRLRALAVASTAPSALAPGLPTVAESGLPDFETSSHFGIFAPAKTPSTVIVRLSQEITRALNRAEAKERLFNVGIETAPGTPEELAALVRTEIAKWSKVIKDAGMRD
jgi:tripartite-type tricarboxylate transporter receptor subunit TctC